MRKALITIVGRDHPGIVHKVAQALASHKCNIGEVSQTTLLGEFAGLFSSDLPDDLSMADLASALEENLKDSGLAFWLTEFTPEEHRPAQDTEPYVITLMGPDKPDIIPEFTGTMAGFEVNIDNLRAVTLSSAAGSLEKPVALVFEVSVPRAVHQRAFRQALSLKAEELGLEVSLQHRDIFEAVHRL